MSYILQIKMNFQFEKCTKALQEQYSRFTGGAFRENLNRVTCKIYGKKNEDSKYRKDLMIKKNNQTIGILQA